MNPFSSLFTKILFWFFLNLTLVAVVLVVFFTFQFQMDLDAVFGRRMFDRMQVAGRLISHELNATSETNWPDVLTRHSEIHQVHFALVLEDGTKYLSKDMKLPEDILKAVVGHFPPKLHPERFPMPPKPNDMPPEPMNRPAGEPFGFKGPGADGTRPPPQDGLHGHTLRLMMHTKDPAQYWARILIPVTAAGGRPGRPSLGVLLAASDSMTGNGFFFDPFPWIIIALAVLLISVLLWIPLTRSITRPIARMTRAAEEIARGRFDVRIEERREDEIGRLGSAINHMTLRLSSFMKGQKRFLGDVAHELGSPIARIQLGIGILEHRVSEENRQRVADVMEDVAHMSNLVNELLSFSKVELDHPARTKLSSTALLALTQEVVEREGTEKTKIITQIDPDMRAIANPDLLARALSNLVRNAVRYAGTAGPIFITAERIKDQVAIEIKDNGPGVDEALLDQIFEPFYRPEPSRDRDSGGVGLGLAIVKTCIEACNGTVCARNSTPFGLAVTITLKA